MPKNVGEIVGALNEQLREKIRLTGSEPVLTIPWGDFYKICEMTRFKEPRPSQIQYEASQKFGLLVAYGDKVVVVAHDRNFAPFE